MIPLLIRYDTIRSDPILSDPIRSFPEFTLLGCKAGSSTSSWWETKPSRRSRTTRWGIGLAVNHASQWQARVLTLPAARVWGCFAVGCWGVRGEGFFFFYDCRAQWWWMMLRRRNAYSSGSRFRKWVKTSILFS